MRPGSFPSHPANTKKQYGENRRTRSETFIWPAARYFMQSMAIARR
jgi:hypothetical protein